MIYGRLLLSVRSQTSWTTMVKYLYYLDTDLMH